MKRGHDDARDRIAAFLTGCAVSCILCALFTFLLIKRSPDLVDARAPQQIAMHPSAELYDTEGGRIEALQLPLGNPGAHPPDEKERLKPASWFFEKHSAERLESFFQGLNVSEPLRQLLLDRQFWTVTSNGCTLTAPSKFVWEMPADVRSKIYSVLADSSANYPQQVPFRFPPNGFETMLRMAGLSPAQVQQLERLTYYYNGSTCFADLQCAREILNAADFGKLTDSLYQTPTYSLRLHVPAGTNIDALVRYWGQGGREALIRPLLNAAAKVPGGASVAISTLLPSYARLHLYTYPDSWRDHTAAQQDCHYTALNFFNEPADTNLLGFDYAKETLASKYDRVEGIPALGDVILFLDESGKSRHSSVFLVGDFVFTKNGVNASAPWVIMRLNEVAHIYYGGQAPKEVVFLRKKQSGAQITARLH